jgi:hypothetical protein
LISISGRKKSRWPSSKGAVGVQDSHYPLIQSLPLVLFVSVAKLVHHMLYPILLFMGPQYPAILRHCLVVVRRCTFSTHVPERRVVKKRGRKRVRRIGHEAREVKGGRVGRVLR